MADKLEVKYTNEKYLKLLPWKIMYRSGRKEYYLQGEFHGNFNKTFILKMQTVFKRQNFAEFMVAGLTK